MSKSLKRLRLADILKNIDDFSIVKLHFVLRDKSVVLASPLKMENKNLFIKDAMGHVIKLPLSSIIEIWQDSKI